MIASFIRFSFRFLHFTSVIDNPFVRHQLKPSHQSLDCRNIERLDNRQMVDGKNRMTIGFPTEEELPERKLEQIQCRVSTIDEKSFSLLLL